MKGMPAFTARLIGAFRSIKNSATLAVLWRLVKYLLFFQGGTAGTESAKRNSRLLSNKEEETEFDVERNIEDWSECSCQ